MKFQNVTDKMAMEFKQIVFMYKIVQNKLVYACRKLFPSTR